MDEFCPNCLRHSIKKDVCMRCKRDFCFKPFKGTSPSRIGESLPKVRDMIPCRTEYSLRDNNWKEKIRRDENPDLSFLRASRILKFT